MCDTAIAYDYDMVTCCNITYICKLLHCDICTCHICVTLQQGTMNDMCVASDINVTCYTHACSESHE